MLYKVGEPIVVVYQAAAVETGATIKMDIYDEAHAKGDTPPCVAAMTEITYNATPTGRYYATFTPDAAGTWIALMYEDGGGGEVVKAFIVDTADEFGIKAVVDSIETKVDTIDGEIETIDTEVGNLATALQTVDDELATVDGVVDGIVTDIAALNDISTANVATELATYDGPTKAELDVLGTAALATAAALTTVDNEIETIDTEVGVIDGIVDDILVDTAAIDTAVGATGGIRGADSDSLKTLSDQLDAIVVPAMVG